MLGIKPFSGCCPRMSQTSRQAGQHRPSRSFRAPIPQRSSQNQRVPRALLLKRHCCRRVNQGTSRWLPSLTLRPNQLPVCRLDMR